MVTAHSIKRLIEEECWDDGFISDVKRVPRKPCPNRLSIQLISHIPDDQSRMEVDRDTDIEIQNQETDEIPVPPNESEKEQ